MRKPRGTASPYNQVNSPVSTKEKQNQGSGWPKFGPGFIVAAAFVGPGTVVTATTAGQQFGLSLVWVILFSVFAAIILQEMATRLGTLTGIGLGELLRRQFPAKATLVPIALLVIAAIGFGNAAYQTGNLTGASYGIGGLLALDSRILTIVIALIASSLLWFGSYKVVESVLVGAVAFMGLAFVIAAMLVLSQQSFSWSELAPNIPDGSVTVIMALIGTTLVPYNLFLHASASSKRWSSVRPRDRGLKLARLDSLLGICAGGIVTLSILIAAAAANSPDGSTNAGLTGLAQSLTVLVGNKYAHVLFSIGVAAAGLSSAITAPLAGALAVCGVLGWSTESHTLRFRAVWGVIMLCGVSASLLLGSSPEETIIVAQAANLIALPIIAGILLMACNAKLLSRYKNTSIQNMLTGTIVVLVTALSVYKLLNLIVSLTQ